MCVLDKIREKEIKIVDTTLRDGEQTAGVAFANHEKVTIAQTLSDMGIDQLEVGIPTMGGDEKATIKAICKRDLKASIMAWNRAVIADIEQSIDCGVDAVAISLSVSDIHIQHKLKKSREWVLENMYNEMKDHIDFYFNTPVSNIEVIDGGYRVFYKDEYMDCDKCIVSVGRSGSKWIENVCQKLEIPTKSNRVDIGVRVELPAVIFAHLTDELYESKIVYRTEKFEDLVRTFCMNPNGIVVNENTNGIVTVNGHSYEGAEKQTENTNFALLVAKHFSEPFKDSNGYGESIARLSNMLGGGVIVQRFGDLMRGRRSTEKRIEEGLVKPTLAATPGDLSLVLPKRILDGIIEMIYALDKIAPGTANDDTLLYGVEVKFYNMEVEIDNNLETRYKGLYIIGDGSGVTHSLSHASASGVYVARKIIEEM